MSPEKTSSLIVITFPSNHNRSSQNIIRSLFVHMCYFPSKIMFILLLCMSRDHKIFDLQQKLVSQIVNINMCPSQARALLNRYHDGREKGLFLQNTSLGIATGNRLLPETSPLRRIYPMRRVKLTLDGKLDFRPLFRTIARFTFRVTTLSFRSLPCSLQKYKLMR